MSGIDKANYPSREAPEQIFTPQEFTDYYYAQSDALQRRGNPTGYEAFSLRSHKDLTTMAQNAVYIGIPVASCNLSDPIERGVWLRAWEQAKAAQTREMVKRAFALGKASLNSTENQSGG